MAYDGIVVSSIISEIKKSCLGGRCLKIQQPSPEIITLTIKGFKGQTKLYISASASLPIVYIADTLPNAPMQAPAFCMLLRKHLANGRLTDIRQPGFDRIFDFVFEHMDEMGDISERHLIVEIMGRQSNIILADNDYKILDCIKRIMPDFSFEEGGEEDKKIRILYPGQVYTQPDSQGKINPLEGFDRNVFEEKTAVSNGPVAKCIFSTITGFSKSISEELVYRAGIDSRATIKDITPEMKDKLYEILSGLINDISQERYLPVVAYNDGIPKDYHVTRLTMYEAGNGYLEEKQSASSMLADFYRKKETAVNIRTKSQDIRKFLNTSIERASRKYDQQLQQLRSTEDRDKYRVYGELLNTYGYELKGGEESLKCINYYDNQEITIPLDKDLTASENSKRYFEKYNKKKRTFAALTEFVEKTKQELDYLMSVRHSLDIADTESDIEELRKELEDSGLLKKQKKQKGKPKVMAGVPLHYISSEGYDIYVGKNNIQNDSLTFDLATGKDLWFHSKGVPGSHVIVKLKPEDSGLDDIPDSVFEEAASLAAYYSSSKDAPKVEIDYTQRKNLKKPPAANPGYVIYHTNYSMMARPDKGNLVQVEEGK